MKWMCGCPTVNALFCFPCLVFAGEYMLTKLGVKDFKHFPEKSGTTFITEVLFR